MMSRFSYNVAPRYTCGSPALVDQATAERVAREECKAFYVALSGRYGDEEARATALKLGLGGIVEARETLARSYRFRDLLTGESGERRTGGR